MTAADYPCCAWGCDERAVAVEVDSDDTAFGWCVDDLPARLKRPDPGRWLIEPEYFSCGYCKGTHSRGQDHHAYRAYEFITQNADGVAAVRRGAGWVLRTMGSAVELVDADTRAVVVCEWKDTKPAGMVAMEREYEERQAATTRRRWHR